MYLHHFRSYAVRATALVRITNHPANTLPDTLKIEAVITRDQSGTSSLLIRDSATGSIYLGDLTDNTLTLSNPVQMPGGVSFKLPAEQWKLHVTDFNGDTVSDVIAHHANGQVFRLSFQGTVIEHSALLKNQDGSTFTAPTWNFLGTGKIDGEPYRQIFFKTPIGTIVRYPYLNQTLQTSVTLASMGLALNTGSLDFIAAFDGPGGPVRFLFNKDFENSYLLGHTPIGWSLFRNRAIKPRAATYVTPALKLENLLDNGDFSIWPRGTNFTSVRGGPPGFAGPHTASHWESWCGWSPVAETSRAVLSREAFPAGQNLVPGRPRHFYRHNQVAAVPRNPAAAINVPTLRQRIENVALFQGKTLQVSFWARSPGKNLKVTPVIRQNPGDGSGSNGFFNWPTPAVIVLTDTWAQYTAQITLSPLPAGTKIVAPYSRLTLDFMLDDAYAPSAFIFDIALVKLSVTGHDNQFLFRHREEELARAARFHHRENYSNRETVASGVAQPAGRLEFRIPFNQFRSSPIRPWLGISSSQLVGLDKHTREFTFSLGTAKWAAYNSEGHVVGLSQVRLNSTPEEAVLNFDSDSSVFSAGEQVFLVPWSGGAYIDFEGEINLGYCGVGGWEDLDCW